MRRNKNESQRADQLTVMLCGVTNREEHSVPREKQFSLNAENMQTCQTGPLFHCIFFSVSVTS